MIELPEARTIARDLRSELLGKKIVAVGGIYTGHKFTFYEGDPNQYKDFLIGKKITAVIDRNFYVEIMIEDYKLLIRDGVRLRYFKNGEEHPLQSKLSFAFDDGSFLNFTVSMYGMIGVIANHQSYENEYYKCELTGVSPISVNFTHDYFMSLIDSNTLKLSAKAFLGTEQRFLGIGNGVLQDILFEAKIHPKTKINRLTSLELEQLYHAIIKMLPLMIEKRGRDTEIDIYGNSGLYETILSNKTYGKPCPICQSFIQKEQYLGGSIYYCPNCQILKK